MARVKYPKPRRPKYRYHKASGRGVIQYGPLYGPNPKYLDGDFNSEVSLAHYEKCVAEILAHQLRGVKPPPTPKRGTVADLLLAYLLWAEEYYGGGPRSEFANMKDAVRHLSKVCGRVKLAEFKPSDLKKVRTAMVADGLARNTINARVNKIRRAFRWGVENDMLEAAVVHKLEMVAALRKGRTKARETAPVEPPTQDAVERVLPFVAEIVRDMIDVHQLTGMRSGELVRLNVPEIDRRDTVWLYVPRQHKTEWRGKRKVIPIGPRAQKILKKYLGGDGPFLFSPKIATAQHQAERVKHGHKPKPPRHTVRERYSPNTYANAINHGFWRLAKSLGHNPVPRGTPWRRWLRQEGISLKEWLASVGIEHWHPHQLRHARSTATREAYDLEGAQALLGNTVQATERYAEKSIKLAKKIARKTG